MSWDPTERHEFAYHRALAPIANVAGPRTGWDWAALKARDLLNMAMLAYPNVVVDLAMSVRRGKKAIRAVAQRLDDPAAFATALATICRADD